MNHAFWISLLLYGASSLILAVVAYKAGIERGIHKEQDRFRRYTDERLRAERTR